MNQPLFPQKRKFLWENQDFLHKNNKTNQKQLKQPSIGKGKVECFMESRSVIGVEVGSRAKIILKGPLIPSSSLLVGGQLEVSGRHGQKMHR